MEKAADHLVYLLSRVMGVTLDGQWIDESIY
jgi:hypothetical protein